MSGLNEEQAAAADLSRSAVVSAGAGSGKTRVLTTRWLDALVLHGFRPERLLALTFTQKAAGEMRERLQRVVDTRAEAGEEGWRAARDAMWRAEVGTVHAFCAALLREFPIEAGVDPDFSVLEETDRQVLADEVALQTVDRLAEARDADLGEVARHWPRRYLSARLADALADRERHGAWAEVAAGETPEALLRRWRELAGRVRRAAGGAVLADDGARRALVAFLGRTPDDGDWPGLVERLLTQAGRPRARGVSEDLAPAAEAVARHRADLALCIGPADAAAARLLPSLARVVLAAFEAYDGQCERARRLDFDALQGRAVALLAHDGVRARVRARYDEVMVDEAQDTSPAQWSLIRALVTDGGWPARGFFAVGDDKQSIYGFRGAAPAAFRRLAGEVEAGGGRALSLDTSYRMAAAPLRFANLLAGRLLPGLGPPLSAGRADAADVGAVEILAISGDGGAAERTGRLAALVARRLVRALDERGARPRDAALLLRSRTHLGAWEEALWRVGLPYVTAAGVGFFGRREVLDLCALLAHLHDPRDDIALATVLRSPLFAVSDVALFRLKAFRRGGLLAALRTGAADLPDPWDRASTLRAVEVLGRLRALAGRLPAGRLLRHAVEATGYLGVLAAQPRGDQALANVDKLIGLVRDEAGPLGPLVRRLDRLLSRADRESQAAVVVEGVEGVRVMTVHASKGLEFPIVAVGDLGARIRSSLAAPVYIGVPAAAAAGAGAGAAAVELAPSLPRSDDDDRPVVRRLLADDLRSASAAEEARLLYVACTRARDVLLLATTLSRARGAPGTVEAPVDLLRDPLRLGRSDPEVAATLARAEVAPDALPDDLRIPIVTAVDGVAEIPDPPQRVLAEAAAAAWTPRAALSPPRPPRGSV